MSHTQYICHGMTLSSRPSNRPRIQLAWVLSAFLALLGGCDRSPTAPHAEFIVAAGDSTYWVKSDRSGIRLRGSPMVLARLNGSFRELYVVDDDRSFENALFVSQRLYQRDLVSGDSTEIFRDTLVAALSDLYATRHPDARRLSPDEESGVEPSITATADVSVLGVHGPYLSVEYHADTSGVSDDSWHMTRHVVIDLRTGKQVTLAEVLTPTESSPVLRRARTVYRETLDSVRRDPRAAARRAARSLGRFRFDANSFSLTAPNGTLMIAFSAPGQGIGGEGFTMPMRPIPVNAPAWWTDARLALPTSTKEREEHWARDSYLVKAVYDTAATPVRLSLVDSTGREFEIGGVAAPVHRIYWLDNPVLDRTHRAALTRAFDEAALYDDAARADAGRALSPTQLVARR